MIIGGTDISQGPVIKWVKVSAAMKGLIWGCMSEDILAFNEEDFETFTRPHNDVLVISFILNNIQINLVLVDLGSATNVIKSKVVKLLRLLDQIVPTSGVLNGFNMAGEATKGEITIPVNMSDAIQDAKFHVIGGDMRYNTLLGRPWIHNIRAVPSTLHQMMKFPTKDDIKTGYGEQHAAKEMFMVHWEASNSIHSTSEEPGGKQTPEDNEEDFLAPRTFVAPKESDATKSTIKELEQAVLIEHLPNQNVYLGTGLTSELRKKILQFLIDSIDCFAWSHLDMTGIPLEITTHRLSVDPRFKPGKQKKKPQSEIKYAFIKDDVTKLLKIGSIREVKYPKWQANVVVVPKKGNKLRMCVEYKDLNKVCPKDSFPLFNIDCLIYAMAGHETLTFLDGYSGYNQI
ncbi:uncharacterized protein [Nicotiana sylvestris]|uniref:uncharacterized protein n=1 Tax=Nicotiana sylvestris TaxID=4096 RepID=UPI00388CD75B